MTKINLDKYYTSASLAEYCVDKTKEVIGVENITQWLEPGAGAGAFLPYLDNNYLAFDIEPEGDNIIQQDYLKLELPYLAGRCIIGNPPFGSSNHLSLKFYKNSLKYGDYIAFIQPASQYNNNQRMYEFDLIHSELLPMQRFSGRDLLCSFNIYKRPDNSLNKKPINYTLKDVEVFDWRRGAKNAKIPENCDIGICSWGVIGKVAEYQDQFVKTIYITVHNDKYREAVIAAIEGADWELICPSVATPSLPVWRVYRYLKEQIPELV